MTRSIVRTQLLTRITSLLFVALFTAGMGVANPMSDEPKTIEITGQDNLRFSLNEIHAKPGETIRIVFKVKSALPGDAMSHNLAIVKPDTPMDEFVSKSMQAKKTKYIAPSFKDQVLAATEMISGGATSIITFTVPDTPGTYPYVCTFPGHFAAGMSGKLIIEDEKGT